MNHVLISICILLLCQTIVGMTEKRRIELKDLTKEMFDHGWNSYMQHAYPADELNPFECKGRGSDKANPSNINVNDVLGDYSLTLVDTLDTLAILGTQEQFEDAVYKVIQSVSFNQDNKVQVFELNIRALGGLLSAHLLATEPILNHTIKGYQDELLKLAIDLADRLMPAFEGTEIPYPRVNLKRGVPTDETTETCTAGAGSLILEFGVLSRLTGEPRYERAAKRALRTLWTKRSSLNLLGNVIDLRTGQWIHTASSTGAGIDSVFEYMFKAYVLFGEAEYQEMFETAYEAIQLYVRDRTGYVYRNVHMSTGSLMSYWIDSLSAFFPGLQVLAGDVESAARGHLVYYHIWKRYHGLPERFDFHQRTVDLPFYPLRPEFIESTYYLYQATRDPFYLEVGEMVLHDLNNRTRLPCGFASMGDVRTGRLEDRMESFMLSETLKYLYLLFDTDHMVHRLDDNFVFTTEGHLLPLPAKYLKASGGRGVCARHDRLYLGVPGDLEMNSVRYLPMTDYASVLTGAEGAKVPVSSRGYCESPVSSYRLSFEGTETALTKQANLIDLLSGYFLKSLSGLNLELVMNTKNDGFFIKRVNKRTTSHVTIPLSALQAHLPHRQLRVQVYQATHSLIRDYERLTNEVRLTFETGERCYEFLARANEAIATGATGLTVYGDTRWTGCEPFRDRLNGTWVVVSSGQCELQEKVRWAVEAEAAGLIVIGQEEQGVMGLPVVSIEETEGWVLARYARVARGFRIERLPELDQADRLRLMFLGKKVDNVNVVF